MLAVIVAGLAGKWFLHRRRLAAGLVLQFGEYKESTESGLRWRLPYPIQSHEMVNISGVRTIEVGYRGSEKNKVLKEALMLTDDENIINIQFAVQYILKDPVDYIFNNRTPDEAVMQVGRNGNSRDCRQEQNGLRSLRRARADRVQASALMQKILDRYKPASSFRR
jgi:membrane protease subunit HflK